MTAFDKIKKISKEKGYSLSSVNEKAGLGTNVIYGWKTKKPDYENLRAVADVLGVSVDYLLGNTDEMHPNNEPTDDLKKYFEEHHIVRYDGKPIPDSDLEVIKRILESN